MVQYHEIWCEKGYLKRHGECFTVWNAQLSSSCFKHIVSWGCPLNCSFLQSLLDGSYTLVYTSALDLHSVPHWDCSTPWSPILIALSPDNPLLSTPTRLDQVLHTPSHKRGLVSIQREHRHGCPYSSITTALPAYLNYTHFLPSTLTVRCLGYQRRPRIDTIFLNVLGRCNVTAGTLLQPQGDQFSLLYKDTLFLANLATSVSSVLLVYTHWVF